MPLTSAENRKKKLLFDRISKIIFLKNRKYILPRETHLQTVCNDCNKRTRFEENKTYYARLESPSVARHINDTDNNININNFQLNHSLG